MDGTGRYDESVDDRTLAGADVLDGTANEAVLDMLRSAGLLLKASPFVHRYPYDWRTARPVILRATPQASIGSRLHSIGACRVSLTNAE